MLLRCRLIKPYQWIEIDKFAREHPHYQSIRLTNRQTFQYHGVQKGKLQPMHRLLHSISLDSIATAADMNRNVLCTSNPIESKLHQQAYEFAKKSLNISCLVLVAIWMSGSMVKKSKARTIYSKLKMNQFSVKPIFLVNLKPLSLFRRLTMWMCMQTI